MGTATVIAPASGGGIVSEEGRVISTRPSLSDRRSGCLLLAQIVDELDQIDRRVPILGGSGMETLPLTVGQTVESGLVLGGRLKERLGDGSLQILGKLRIVGIGSVDDLRRFVDDPEIFLLHRRAVGILQHALA